MILQINRDNTTVFTPDEIDIEEEERRSLPDRIKEAIEEYGVVMINRETAKKFFHANAMDFWNAIIKLEEEEGYKIQAYIGKGDTNE